MQKVITLTGAVGKVGRNIISFLTNRSIYVRAVMRHPEKFTQSNLPGIEVFQGDIADTDFLTQVFTGSDAVLAIVPDNFDVPDFKEHKKMLAGSLVSAVRKAKIDHVIAISSVGTGLDSETGPIEALKYLEEKLKETENLNTMILRCAFFMDNFLNSIPLIKGTGINGGGFSPDTLLPMISTTDVARIAADYLSILDFTGFNVRELLGPKDYTFPEVTAAIGMSIGKPALPYIHFPYGEVKKALLSNGFSDQGADALLESIQSHNQGRIQRTYKRTPENTTPTTIEQFAKQVFSVEYKKEYSTGILEG